MEKPKTIISGNDEILFKDFCIIFNAKYAWLDGVKYRLPLDKWKEEKK